MSSLDNCKQKFQIAIEEAEWIDNEILKLCNSSYKEVNEILHEFLHYVQDLNSPFKEGLTREEIDRVDFLEKELTIEDTEVTASVFALIGTEALVMKNLLIAEKFFNEANRRSKNGQGVPIAHFGLGIICQKQARTTQALKHFECSKKLYIESRDFEKVKAVINLISEIKDSQNPFISAFKLISRISKRICHRILRFLLKKNRNNF